jgi:hypothetical protein
MRHQINSLLAFGSAILVSCCLLAALHITGLVSLPFLPYGQTAIPLSVGLIARRCSVNDDDDDDQN